MAFLRDKSVYCITTDEITEPQREVYSYVCLATAALSALGACVQLRGWYKLIKTAETRRIPSPTPHIVFSLALADVFACVGVIAMSILFITFTPPIKIKPTLAEPAKTWYWYIGVPVESFTMFSYVASYMWTLMYAIDICLQVHNHHKSVHGCMYHLISWLVPMWIVGCGQYGFLVNTKPYCSFGERTALHYMVCYVPLLIVMLMLPPIYWITNRRIRQNINGGGYFTDREREFLKAVRKKFLCIIGVFFLCWILNVMDGLHDVIYHLEDAYTKVHFPLWMCEAVINPLQGFLNCLVYGQHKQFVHGCCQQGDENTEYIITEVSSTLLPSQLEGPHDHRHPHPLPEWFGTKNCKDSDEILSSSESLSTPFSVRLLGEHKRL